MQLSTLHCPRAPLGKTLVWVEQILCVQIPILVGESLFRLLAGKCEGETRQNEFDEGQQAASASTQCSKVGCAASVGGEVVGSPEKMDSPM